MDFATADTTVRAFLFSTVFTVHAKPKPSRTQHMIHKLYLREQVNTLRMRWHLKSDSVSVWYKRVMGCLKTK